MWKTFEMSLHTVSDEKNHPEAKNELIDDTKFIFVAGLEGNISLLKS